MQCSAVLLVGVCAVLCSCNTLYSDTADTQAALRNLFELPSLPLPTAAAGHCIAIFLPLLCSIIQYITARAYTVVLYIASVQCSVQCGAVIRVQRQHT